jgi:hypothetical protein
VKASLELDGPGIRLSLRPWISRTSAMDCASSRRPSSLCMAEARRLSVTPLPRRGKAALNSSIASHDRRCPFHSSAVGRSCSLSGWKAGSDRSRWKSKTAMAWFPGFDSIHVARLEFT